MLDITDLSIYSDDKVRIVSYHVPLLELLLGYLALHLFNLFKPSSLDHQIRKVREYENAGRATYKMDFDGVRALLRIPKWT
jgi:hypothetical protein